MVESIFVVLGAALQIWEHYEKNKYVDKLVRLKREWYEEYNKPDDKRDNAVLDSLEFELRTLCGSFATEVRAKNSGN